MLKLHDLISAEDLSVSDHTNFSRHVCVRSVRKKKFEIFFSTIIDVDNVPLDGSGRRICQKGVDEVGVVVARVQRLLLVLAAKDFVATIVDDLDQVRVFRIRIVKKKIVAFQINLQLMFIINTDVDVVSKSI